MTFDELSSLIGMLSTAIIGGTLVGGAIRYFWIAQKMQDEYYRLGEKDIELLRTAMKNKMKAPELCAYCGDWHYTGEALEFVGMSIKECPRVTEMNGIVFVSTDPPEKTIEEVGIFEYIKDE